MRGSLWKTLLVVGVVVGIVYVLVGIAGGLLWSSHWEEASTSDQAFWLVLLTGGGAAILAGLRLFERSPWTGATLVSLGALAGALVLVWTLTAPLLAIALVVLSIVHARRLAAT